MISQHQGKIKMSSACCLLGLLVVLTQNSYARVSPPVRAVQRSPRQCAPSKLKFSYNLISTDGPEKWQRMSQCCSGVWQSPINIITRESNCNRDHSIRYTRHPLGPIRGILYNPGYAVTMDFSKSQTPSLLGVPYWENTEYSFGNLHFHAGSISGRGSEHYVDNQGFDAELHLVHFKKEYKSIKEAMKRLDGLVVVGIFLKEENVTANTEMADLIMSTQQALEKGTKLLFEVDIRQLFPWRKQFYVYHGSLTTPPCSESVRWLVMRDPISISTQCLQILRSARMADGTLLGEKGNCRPFFHRNGRQVETNFPCPKK